MIMQEFQGFAKNNEGIIIYRDDSHKPTPFHHKYVNRVRLTVSDNVWQEYNMRDVCSLIQTWKLRSLVTSIYSLTQTSISVSRSF